MVAWGVLYGSTLDPLLFLLYINYLQKALLNQLFVFFEGYANIFTSGENFSQIESGIIYNVKFLIKSNS